MPSDGKSSRCLWQGELKKKKTKLMLENTEGAIKNGQSRETGNILWYTKRRKTKQKHNTISIGHHNMQTNTNNVNKT
jgi:hypothetical protein